MTHRIHLTPEQEDDITRRYKFGRRCDEWLRHHGQHKIAEHFNIVQSQVAKALQDHYFPRKLNDDQKRRLLTLAQRAKRVQIWHVQNSLRTLMKEYGISAERIKRIAGDVEPMLLPETPKHGPTCQFLYGQLIPNPVPDRHFYY